MNMTILGICLVLMVCSVTCAQPGQISAKGAAGGDKVSLQVIEHELYVPVSVKGKERLWLLDSGAGSSVIDKGFAQGLGLRLSGKGQGMGAAGSVRFEFATVPRLRVGGIELDNQQMVALDITPLLRRTIGTEPAGVLGYGFLSRFVTKVDYARKEVTFFRPGTFAYHGPGHAISMRIQDNIPVVEMQVEGKYRGPWRLDLGASVAVFHHHAVDKFGLASRKGVERIAMGVGGGERHRLVRFADAELAGFKVKGPILSVPLEGGAGALAAAGYLGTLGNSILRNFTLFLDYRNHRAIFERGGNFGKEMVLDRSGLQVIRKDTGSFEVICVAPGTPAEKSGFRTGDLIETVDGRSPEGLGGLDKLRELLRAASGTRYRIGVRRGDAHLSLDLVLEDLY